MKRFLNLFAIALMAGMVLVGCKKNNNENTSPYPEDLTGFWSGAVKVDKVDCNAVMEIYSHALNGSCGNVTITFEGSGFVYDMPSWSYDPQTGIGSFKLLDTVDSPEWNDCTGTFKYDLTQKALVGTVKDNDDGEVFTFTLIPTPVI